MNSVDCNLAPISLTWRWPLIVIDQLIKLGAGPFYFSPGLRNAPIIGAIQSLAKSQLIECLDERAAAFRALGVAKSEEKIGVLICTSGTAMANYLPAILEAKKSETPFLIIAADRPETGLWGNANQTLKQNEIYPQHVNHQLELPLPTERIRPHQLAHQISWAYRQAKAPTPGPVLINFPLVPPLEKFNGELESLEYQKQSLKVLGQPLPYTSIKDINDAKVDKEVLTKINGKKCLFVIGELNDSKDGQSLVNFLQRSQFPYILDITSNVKFSLNGHEQIPSLGHPEVLRGLIKNPPELIIQIGGNLTAKGLEQILDRDSAPILVKMDSLSSCSDNTLSCQFYLKYSSGNLFSLLELLAEAIDRYQGPGPEVKATIEQKRTMIRSWPELNFPRISMDIVENSPSETCLYIGNSTAIRSCDLYWGPGNINLSIAAHRGVSGIEGMVAAALGLLDSDKYKRVILFLGDVSLIHDLNSLKMIQAHPGQLIIILANNLGGGIFTLLPINEQKEVIEYLYTPHSLEFSNITSQFRIPYQSIGNIKEWEKCVHSLDEISGHQFIEVSIKNRSNQELYDQLKTMTLN